MAASENRSLLDRLTDLRAQQEAVLASCEPGQFASLSKEYRATLERIEALAPAEKKGTVVDELKARRATRGAEAKRPGRPARQAK